MTKVCNKCKKELDVSMFYRRAWLSMYTPRGYHDSCKACKAIYDRSKTKKALQRKAKSVA